LQVVAHLEVLLEDTILVTELFRKVHLVAVELAVTAQQTMRQQIATS
jgi:hypothetical protein